MNAYLVLTIALPLLGAFLLPILMRSSIAIALWSGPAILIYGCWTIADIWLQGSTQPVSIAIGGFAPPLGINLYIDSLALLFAFAVQLLGLIFWPFTLDQDSARRQSLMLLLVAASTGLALSGDLFNLYVFYELAAVATFGLASASGSSAAYVATLRYLILSGIGSVLTLFGIALIYSKTGTLNLAHLAQLAPAQLNDELGLTAFLSILIGIGVKAELFPVNTWVPEIYATASTRLSAFLAGLLSKLALLIILRLLLLIFHQPEAAQVLLILGILGVVSGELAAWRAKELRRMLAFSSIGQLGVMFIAMALPDGAGVLAVLALAIHHLIIKSGLFMLAEDWGGAIQRLRGSAKMAPLGAALFVLFSLSLVGMPPLPGFWAKFTLITELAGQSEPLYLIGLAVFLLATVIEASYLFRVAAILYQDAPRETLDHEIPKNEGLSLVTATLFGAGLIAAAVMIAPVGDSLNTIAVQVQDIDLYISTVNPGGSQ
ncbi:MAG: NADH-quinone oxidoreductase subunit J [Candidatus Thiodiazotropha sp. (ex Lucina aurantia)]|nr:NADH-quinone oxidoreductase subunit J [Candidatus Thiodiazotropha sp. (ex Lucina pensylvanica)]MBT3015553.1 NADH-quinone oxidoreductase subunit J [Candidatus Thiodiazotropha taylori]MBT3040315.1 NADH-quinone oxidoreductase subunit J [Candidatus Thiodiazotropha sp. (ex Codakia orbicularis)]MBV2103158.1 NADH-quinone oxidoreductase subunit J [Candidatus Thiodiazotropha sp. (ex Lucina aurantia)]MBT3023381.1 NADH-quinone oxidoreductase subunit J [Candidatus Thiodiazotropha taylori]